MVQGLAFFLSLVRKHGPERNITDALDTLDGGVELVINHNTALVVNLDANLVQVQAIGVGPTTNSDENDVCVELMRKSVHVPIYSANKLTDSSLPPLAASVLTTILPSCFSAERTFVLRRNLIPCFARIFWNVFLNEIRASAYSKTKCSDKHARNLLVNTRTTDSTQELDNSDFRA